MKKFLKSAQSLLICPRRINRVNFLLRVLFWYVVVPFITFRVAAVSFGSVPEWILGIIGFLMTIGIISATISRLHDCNMSGWYVLLGFIPIVNLSVVIWTFFCSGSKGKNKFGDEPKHSQGLTSSHSMLET